MNSIVAASMLAVASAHYYGAPVMAAPPAMGYYGARAGVRAAAPAGVRAAAPRGYYAPAPVAPVVPAAGIFENPLLMLALLDDDDDASDSDDDILKYALLSGGLGHGTDNNFL